MQSTRYVRKRVLLVVLVKNVAFYGTHTMSAVFHVGYIMMWTSQYSPITIPAERAAEYWRWLDIYWTIDARYTKRIETIIGNRAARRTTEASAEFYANAPNVKWRMKSACVCWRRTNGERPCSSYFDYAMRTRAKQLLTADISDVSRNIFLLKRTCSAI